MAAVESFPRGKAPALPAAAAAAKKQSSLPKGDNPSHALAAKRKRAAAAATQGERSSPAPTTPSAAAVTDDGPDFLFGLPKKKAKPAANGGVAGAAAGGASDPCTLDEASKIAQAMGLGCVTKSGRGPPQIQNISLRKMVRGTTMLGIVTRVGPKDVGVALPGGLSGRVSLPEISDPLYARFAAAASGAVMEPLQHQDATIALALASLRVGQVVRAMVLVTPVTADKPGLKSATSGSGGKASHKLSLSLRASWVNRGLKLEHILPGGTLAGAVASCEDHGYVVSTGLEGVTAFLPRKHVKGGVDQLTEGSPVEVVVLDVKHASRAVTCGFDPTLTPKALTRGSALTLQGLKPGMLVNAAVDMIFKNGLALSFLGGFSGVVLLDHLDRPYTDSDWRKRFRLGGMLFQARVLLVDTQNKAVYLTLRTHLLGLRPAAALPEVGQVLTQAKVLRVEGKKGLLLGYLPAGDRKDQDTLDEEARVEAEMEAREKKRARAKEEGEDDGRGTKDGAENSEDAKLQKVLQSPRYVPVFVHGAQVEASGSVTVGQTVSCRIIGTAPVEGAVHGSMKAATLEAPFVRVADVTPGQLVQAKVTAVAGWGLTLDLGQGIRAHCTNMHLADGAGPKATSLRAKALAEAKKGKGGRGVYQAGQKVSCRILQVDPVSRKVYATMKPSLLKDAPATVLSAYHEAVPGKTCLGFVTKVGDFGVIVTFYGNVHGLLPTKHLAAQGVETPGEAFRLGQVVRCVVAACEPHRDPPRLSLRLDVPEEAGGNDETASSEGQVAPLRPGQRVKGTVERVQDPYVSVRLDGRGSKEPVALLHKHQLGDHAALGDQLLSRLSKGSRVENALVLELRRDREGPLLSVKPLLLRAGGSGVLDQLEGGNGEPQKVTKGKKKGKTGVVAEGTTPEGPPKLQDLKVGIDRLCGYVSRVENFGVFVRFVGGQVALAPRALIADRFVEDAAGLFREGDSVRCLLHRVDADKGKVFVTMQRSQLPVTDAAFLETLLAESAAGALTTEEGEEADTLDWRAYPIGATVNASVTAVKDYGVVLSAEDHKTVMLAPGPEHVLACAPHDEVKVRVLDVDWAKRVLVVTLLPELVKRGRAKHRKTAEGRSLAVGTKAEAEVVLKRDRYAVVEVGGVLAYLAVADYQCPYLATGNLEVGITVDVLVRRAMQPALEGSAALTYPQEPLPLVTLAQEEKAGGADGGDAAEGGKKNAAHLSKKAEKERKKLQQQHDKAKMAEAAAEKRCSAKKAAAEDRASQKPAAEKVVRKRARAIAAADVVVGATLPAMVVEVRPDELVLALNIQRDDAAAAEAEKEEGGEKAKKAAVPRMIAKVFVTHSGRQRLVDLDEAVAEATEAKKKGEEDAPFPSFHPLAGYEAGQELDVRVVEVREKELSKVKLLECSLRPQDGQAKAADPVALQPAWDTLAVGTVLLGVVTEVQAEGLWVALSRAIKGFVHYLDIARDGDTGIFARLAEAGAVGLPVPVVVTHVDATRHRLQLSIRGVPLTDDLNPTLFPVLPGKASSAKKGKKKAAAESPTVVAGAFQPAVGDLLTGRVCLGASAPSLNPPCVAVQLSHRLYGRLCLTEMEEVDHWVDQPLGPKACPLQDGQDVRCRVVAVENGRIDVSLRSSRLDPTLDKAAAAAEDALPEEGSVVKGYVVGTSTKGCFVRLARGVTARVMIKDLMDGFVKSPTEAFPIGKLVAGRVLKVSAEGKDGPKVDMSLRPSVVVGKHLHALTFEDVQEGMKLKGAVTRVEPFGVFVKLQGSDLTGMCHISEASDQKVKDLTAAYEPGDVVKALVLKVDAETKRISLSLKASRFKGDKEEAESASESEAKEEDEEESESESEKEEEEEEEPDNVKMPLSEGSSSEDEMLVQDDDDEEEDEDDEDAAMSVDGSDEEDEGDAPHLAEESESDSEEEEEEEEVDSDSEEEEEEAAAPQKKVAKGKTPTPTTSASASASNAPAFQWADFDLGLGNEEDAAASGSEDEASGSDDDEDKKQHRSSRKKAAQRKREEEEVREKEERLLDPNVPPETAEDFERLVLANPNSSFLWIKYMAFQLSLADTDAARSLAARALNTIVFREEGEKMNVWVALLNLEHKYGTKETVQATLEKAAQHSNPKHVYLHAAEMYERAGEAEEAEEIFRTVLTKRFKYSKKVWMQCHLLALQRDPAVATELLRRSLQCLARHKHALVISHFAQAEFEHGSVDRGRTIFEGLVSSYPKRLDLWNVYLDKEVKAGHLEAARRLLDRMCTLRLSALKMKGVLKKYLKLEMDHGDAASVERVKTKAREYVESNME